MRGYWGATPMRCPCWQGDSLILSNRLTLNLLLHLLLCLLLLPLLLLLLVLLLLLLSSSSSFSCSPVLLSLYEPSP